jgi:hypothetical protein
MREGVWIVAVTGDYVWVTDHAHTIQSPGQAERLGLTNEVAEQIRLIRWDFNGAGRRAILLMAMAHGLIRARGHGSSITFEFTIPAPEAIQGAMPFLTDVAGPHTFCSFTNLGTQGSVGFYWKDHPKSRS